MYPSKILLFGEYGIIENYCGLSIPHSYYQGRFKFILKFEKKFIQSNYEIKKYCDFLFEKKMFLSNFDISTLYNDIKNGLFFDSNIPQGYGLGSSGALVAAIYDRYFSNKKNDPRILKNIFSKMESFFHGKSSGVDPLICYFNKPFLIFSKKKIFTVKIPQKNVYGKGAIFLLNSGIPSNTSYMIQLFLNKLKNKEFKKILKEEFSKYNEQCIQSFLKNDFYVLLKNVKQLSIWIFDHFKPMIPINFINLWKEGIQQNVHYFKLCGSGGGGFLLGFSPNYEKSKRKLIKYSMEVIFQF